ncbi:hypothetical protein TNCV_4126671 [Trichonephila clavipes]|nr:hypothetical protein TNCV_4126671 [Trichonephila clavipes]
MILCVAELLKDRRRAKNNRCCQEFDIAHSVVSRLWKSFKTTGMCSRRQGGRVRTQQVANQFLAASGKQISRKRCQPFQGRRTIRTQTCCVCPIDQTAPYCPFAKVSGASQLTEQHWACVLFSDESRFSLSSDCRRQLIWRESGTAYHPGKGPISDMQYHGVGRHHDQWTHAPTCGCEWDYDGPTIH